MERLENKLFEAAAKGSIGSLQKLLKDDPLILDRVLVSAFSETPLHVAAMLGHTDFVKEILRIKPELTTELDCNQSSPLHLAAAKGHVDVVKALLVIDHRRMCLYQDRNGLTPLHLAALKGRTEVLKILLQAKPEAAQSTIYRGENILHLCIQHYQIESLKLLVKTIDDPRFINAIDSTGNTILHLAVADKQVETINFLVTVEGLDVDALNPNGMTAMDVLNQSRRDLRDSEIEESLKNAGAMVNTTNPPPVHTISSTQNNTTINSSSSTIIKKSSEKKEWLERMKSSLMIVASLTATMAFQVGVSPPSGLWQDTNNSAVDSWGDPDPHEAGYSIFAHNHPEVYTIFCIVNTTGFIASLSIILLLMSGLPMHRRFFMWVLMVITWIAITALAYVYALALTVLTPSKSQHSVLYVLGCAIIAWALVMALLLLGHTIRLFLKMAKKLTKALGRRMVLAPSSRAVGVSDVTDGV